MPAVNLRAHFDGHSIQLDEPFEFPPNTRLIVTVLPPNDHDEEHGSWGELSSSNLARAYGDDEPEYSDSDILP